MAALSWDLAQPVASAPLYPIGRAHIVVWQSVGSGGEAVLRNVSIMGTAQLAPPVNQVWVTYAEDEEKKR